MSREGEVPNLTTHMQHAPALVGRQLDTLWLAPVAQHLKPARKGQVRAQQGVHKAWWMPRGTSMYARVRVLGADKSGARSIHVCMAVRVLFLNHIDARARYLCLGYIFFRRPLFTQMLVRALICWHARGDRKVMRGRMRSCA